MSDAGPAEIQLDARGSITRCTALAAEILGASSPEVAVGTLFGEWFDESGRTWIDAVLPSGVVGLDERAIGTRAGRVARVRPIDVAARRVALEDATRLAALGSERDRMLAERAVLDLVPVLRRELNDPMSIVLGRLELVLELAGDTDPGVLRHLGVALDHARRVSTTLHLLRMVGRSPPACSPTVALSTAVRAALAEVGPALRVHRLQVPSVEVAADAEVLTQGLVALLGRLVDRAGPGGRCAVVADESGPKVVLSLSIDAVAERSEVDWGGPADSPYVLGVVGAAFARFGIDAEIARGNGGLGFRLALPRAVGVEAPTRADRPVVWLVGVADAGELLARALGRAGCRLYTFETAEQALRQLDHGGPHALLTALCLPGRSGLALLDAVQRRHPELLARCCLVARSSIDGLPPGVKVHSLPLDPDLVLRSLGLGSPP